MMRDVHTMMKGSNMGHQHEGFLRIDRTYQGLSLYTCLVGPETRGLKAADNLEQYQARNAAFVCHRWMIKRDI